MGSSPTVRTSVARRGRVAAALALLLAGCDRRVDVGPVAVSVIGEMPRAEEAARRPLTPAQRLLTDSVAQGLVRFDAAGQIEPGLAERWIVIDDGMSYIFRLRDAAWQDGQRVTARDVVAILKRQLARGSRNPLRPFLSAIDDVVEMTPEVIEVQLARPRPDLLKLFAQPELAIFRARPPGGTGPFRLTLGGRAGLLLAPARELGRAEDEQRAPAPEENVRLVGERAARAILRFNAKQSDLVSGGTVVDWPLVALSETAPANIRLDPATGLFGLAITSRDGFLADPAERDAVAQAFDRPALVAAFANEWPAAETILPEQLDSAAPPAPQPWAATPLAERRANAARRVTLWRAAHDGVAPALRLALPGGSGGNRLWGQLAAGLIAIGIVPQRVGWNEPAELRLVDAVAPYDSARWYLASACAPCGEEAQAALDAARLAPTLADRGQAIAIADAALTADVAFVPLARPFRWSLVSLRLRQWTANGRAWHPLNRLRREPTSR